MREMLEIRQQLAHIRAFLYTCDKRDALLKLLGSRVYLLDDNVHLSVSIASRSHSRVQ